MSGNEVNNSSNRTRQIDQNWEAIFEEEKILDYISNDSLFYITSKKINQLNMQNGSTVDARNMAKFDFISSLPYIFRENKLSILPDRNGRYVIGQFNAYESLNHSREEIPAKYVTIPAWIEALDYTSITSESIVLNAASITGMFNKIFQTDEIFETVNGKMGSGSFEFTVNDSLDADKSYPISVENSMMEIDGGYETRDSLILVEAKNKQIDSFLIRQIYYPYRLWKSKVQKNIIPVYLQFYDDTYDFLIYNFTDPDNYNSLQLVDRKRFKIKTDDFQLAELTAILNQTPIVKENFDIPFPQANSFVNIPTMMTEINSSEEGFISKEDLTLLNDFTYRQADYYANAGAYLGLTEMNDGLISLTAKGQSVISSNSYRIKVELAKAILEHEPFNLAMKFTLRKGEKASGPEIFKLLKDNPNFMPGYSPVTRKRRASTVAKWVNDLIEMTE